MPEISLFPGPPNFTNMNNVLMGKQTTHKMDPKLTKLEAGASPGFQEPV